MEALGLAYGGCLYVIFVDNGNMPPPARGVSSGGGFRQGHGRTAAVGAGGLTIFILLGLYWPDESNRRFSRAGADSDGWEAHQGRGRVADL